MFTHIIANDKELRLALLETDIKRHFLFDKYTKKDGLVVMSQRLDFKDFCEYFGRAVRVFPEEFEQICKRTCNVVRIIDDKHKKTDYKALIALKKNIDVTTVYSCKRTSFIEKAAEGKGVCINNLK